MKILILGSMSFSNEMADVEKELTRLGHEVTLPCFIDDYLKCNSREEMHSQAVQNKLSNDLFKIYYDLIEENDAILIVNENKRGIESYIGANSLIEMSFAHLQGKKIFLLNDIPKMDYTDEIKALNPKCLKKNLNLINPKNIEIEVQTFISKEEYEKLLDFFRDNAEFVKEDFQETFYFDENSNLRIQKNSEGAKLWHKSGNVHDEFMEEIEIRTKGSDFENLEKFLNKLGHSVKIKWLRTRNKFKWNDITVCVDYTKGYGYILELEKMGSEDNKEMILNELKEKLRELGIRETPKEIFEEKYEYYKNNWRELIG